MPTPPEAITGTVHGIGDRAGERDVEALLGAVAVHRGEQDLAGAERHDLARVVDRVEAGRVAAAMGEDLPAVRLARLRHLLGVDRHHDALVAEFLRRLLHEGAPVHRRGVDRDLVGAALQQLADVLHGAHAAADGQRHEAGFRGARHHVEDGVAVLVARRDVEEGQLVGARRVIGDRGLHRIAGVAQVDEVDALDDAAVLHVEAGNDADLEHQARSRGLEQLERLGRIEPAVIERAARDRAFELARAGSSMRAMSSIEASPPEAITGIEIASASAIVASQLMPCSMPSRATSV